MSNKRNQRQRKTNRRRRKGGNQWHRRKGIRRQAKPSRAQRQLQTTPCIVLLQRLPPMAPLISFSVNMDPPIRDLRPILTSLTRDSLADHEFREEYARNKAAAAAAYKALYGGE